jgi:hypothetical protein
VDYEDNEGALKIAKNPMASHMAKHIDIHHHYTREVVDARTIAVISIPTCGMLANGLMDSPRLFLNPSTPYFSSCA